jgi:hypothetical protein
MEPRSGAEAQRMGKVTEYAAAVKAKLIRLGRTEESAEQERLKVIDRWQR